MVLRRLLWALTSILLVVGLAALPVVGDGDGGEGRRDDGRRPTGAADPGEGVGDGGGDGGGGGGGDAAAPEATSNEDGDAAPAAPGAGDAGAGGPTTTTEAPPPPTFPPPAEGLGAPVDPGPPVAPRAGTYRYRATGGPAGTSDGDGESTTTVEERSRAGAEVRLTVTSTGGQLAASSDVVWRPDGVRTLRSTFRFGERSGECDWEPDVVESVFPLSAGATWAGESSCAMTGLGLAPITLRRSLAAEVVDLRRVQVAGRTLDVWAIRRTERLEGAGYRGTNTALVLFSPKHGLDVDVTGTVEVDGERADYRQELLAVDPS